MGTEATDEPLQEDLEDGSWTQEEARCINERVIDYSPMVLTSDERLEETHGCGGEIIEAATADLEDGEEDEAGKGRSSAVPRTSKSRKMSSRNDEGQECSEPDGDDLFPERIWHGGSISGHFGIQRDRQSSFSLTSIVGVDHLAIGKVDGERSRRCGRSLIDLFRRRRQSESMAEVEGRMKQFTPRPTAPIAAIVILAREGDCVSVKLMIAPPSFLKVRMLTDQRPKA